MVGYSYPTQSSDGRKDHMLHAKDLKLANGHRDVTLASRIAAVDRNSAKWTLVDMHRRGFVVSRVPIFDTLPCVMA